MPTEPLTSTGSYDLPTHEALATWERENDIFGWGMLGGETLGVLLAPDARLLLDDLRRVLAERLADAAGIVEDGSINQARKQQPADLPRRHGRVALRCPI